MKTMRLLSSLTVCYLPVLYVCAILSPIADPNEDVIDSFPHMRGSLAFLCP